jgi:hypothetical protein
MRIMCRCVPCVCVVCRVHGNRCTDGQYDSDMARTRDSETRRYLDLVALVGLFFFFWQRNEQQNSTRALEQKRKLKYAALWLIS